MAIVNIDEKVLKEIELNKKNSGFIPVSINSDEEDIVVFSANIPVEGNICKLMKFSITKNDLRNLFASL